MKKAPKLLVLLALLIVFLGMSFTDSRGPSLASPQQRPQTAHLICCNLLVSVPGNWIGASRDCDNYMRNAPADVRADVCRQMRQSGLVCADTAAYCSTSNQPPAKCDTKAACEIVRSMLDLIARYEAMTGFDPGSFARFVNEFNPQLQKLSEALACRFNEGADAPPDAAQLKELLGQLLRDRNSFRTLNRRSEFPQPSACIDRTTGVAIRASLVNRCADYDTVQRIKQNLAGLAGVLGCPPTNDGPPSANVSCQQLSNGLLDGLTTFFDQMDELQTVNRLGSGESYDQVTGGIESALDELQDAAKEIEGTGGTGAQQYQEIQGKIAKLRKLLDVWKQMKAASCLPPEIEQLLRRLAQEKRAGTEHKATCTELCGATADWYVEISGLATQRGTFFKACNLACF